MLRYFKPGCICNMQDEHCQKSNTSDEFALNILRGIFHCNNSRLLQSLEMWQVLKSRGFDGSPHNPMWKKYFPECHGEQKGCREKFANQCSDSKARVSKVPRISLNLAAQLLKTEPNLKIIHLLRDPRAIMLSRDAFKWTPAPEGSLSLCKKMKEDYLESDIIKKTHPERILTVFYEDLVQHPKESVQEMYDFAGFEFDERAVNHLRRMTQIKTKSISPGTTYRNTSAQFAMSWRTKINRTILELMEPGCRDVYKLLGYPSLKTEADLHNSDIPLRILN
ncbi:carbohydrate sulfotransferase 4-like [Pecten maximus]|uniref:carbohydrate sulfotransferase 4-like n=1 Tax=Pecten maximus TaxID=6579 RepID=UPI001458739C|nr:carbohydrate sulfotransferase 4-like [Pecten maximus]